MKARRIEITIQSREILLLKHDDNVSRVWCATCGNRLAASRLSEGHMSSLSIEAIQMQEIESLHLMRPPAGRHWLSRLINLI